MAYPMDKDSGRNMALGTPVITKEGANTASIHSRINNKRKGNFLAGIQDGLSFCFTHFEMLVNIFNGYGGLIHQYTDGQGQPAQGHDIDGLAGKT